jgi:hypothetical protein
MPYFKNEYLDEFENKRGERRNGIATGTCRPFITSELRPALRWSEVSVPMECRRGRRSCPKATSQPKL